MSPEEDNKIVNLGIVVNSQNQVLMIKRRQKETGRDGAILEWSFPGGRRIEGLDDAESLKNKILAKTGYQAEILKKISTREHPQFFVTTNYFLCRLVSEKKKALGSEAEKVALIRWVVSGEVVKLLAIDLDLDVFQELSKLV